MIRSAVFSLITLALLVAGFYVYWQYQPQIAGVKGPTTAAAESSVETIQETQMKIGPGQRAWAKSFDEKGHLSSLFKAEEFTPQKDGSFKVIHPVSVFYMDNGQFMEVTGDHGIVYAESSGAATGADASPIHPPSNGVLQQVHIRIYPTVTATRPTLTIEMNNARFDNETLRLYTQGYKDDNGVTIPADMVPVTVRGDDYEFDGTGLTLRWDDRDHRLQLLEIAHGRRLKIKNPNKVSMPGSPAASAIEPKDVEELPAELVDVSPNSPALAINSARRRDRAVPYRAVFHDNVKIDQGDLQVAAADTMTIDFIQHAAKSAADSKAKPNGGDGYSEPPVPGVVEHPEEPASAGEPATTQANPPITVFWTGKLRLTPLDAEPTLPLAPGQAVVKLVGRPVQLTPQGSTVSAADAIYRTGDSAAKLENSADFPRIELTQQHLHFTADSFAYDPATAKATIGGKSNLDMTTEDGSQVHARWDDRGVFHVVQKEGQPDTVDHGDLFGHVSVNHPRFDLTSTQLALDLEKVVSENEDATSKSSITLKTATAIGDAICHLTETNVGNREIDAQKLVIETAPGPDGKPAPRKILADGSVKATDPEQSLTSGHLEALLRSKSDQPAEKSDAGSMDLESMYAKDSVHAVLKNGTVADSDELRVATVDGHQRVELRGQPAMVNDGKGAILRGPIVQVTPDQQSLAVNGAGTLTRIRKSTTQPVVVTWAKSLNVDGPANTIDVAGPVNERAVDANGTINTMTSNSAHADLTAAPQKEDATATSSDENNFGGKVLKELMLVGNIHGTSTLRAADGSVLRSAELWGPKLNYVAQTNRAQIVGAGHLQTENHKPANVATTEPADALASNYGILVMKWDKSLTYEPADRQVIFTNNVVAWFQQDVKDAGLMQLTHADSVTAYLEPAAASGPVNPGTKQQKMQLSHVTARGTVNFTAKSAEFEGDTIDFDPKTDLLKARGTEIQPAQLHEDDGSWRSFDELIFNIKSQELVKSMGAKGSLR